MMSRFVNGSRLFNGDWESGNLHAQMRGGAGFFLNWAATDEEARTIEVETGGSHPMGPADGFMPEVAEGSVTAATLAAGATISEANGAMDFIANATGSIYAQSWTPNPQKLVAGEQTPEGLLDSAQADYESQVEK